ncbi:hypothetical protein Q8W71_28390 [Methylobacterium sp. NEAU 140]|uniref:hypothetical protein n=1 Tax=Methylobacterium sp. NEAU 140 TaxID=3064945 RepID=UPI002736EA20|nr:hypothetical protein [Methylobacterium sp. NEAU 140]MDP4026540.1 hypothetical protein [Methylobacterium sp. NEAU 140]
MSDLLEGIVFLGRVLLRILLFVGRAAEFLSFFSDLGDLIARGWRRLRGKPKPEKDGDGAGQ